MPHGLHLDKPYDQFTDAERAEQARIDRIGVSLGSLAACVDALIRREADVSPEELVEIDDLYARALALSERVMAHSLR